MNATLHPDWLDAPELHRLAAIFHESGEDLFFVGGCVRDALIGRVGGDVDAATPASPERMQQLLSDAGIASVPTGLAHGTLTALLPREGRKSRPVEITSFRRDVETDGRHATVAFGATMEEDAARRDFTMNALYLSPDGILHDPTGAGVQDARDHRLRFVGDPAQRIAEDGLRLLRFWRFLAKFQFTDWNSAARRACAEARAMLADLSGERIQAEMRKLLSARQPAAAWEAMRADGLLPYLVQSAPEAGCLDAFAAFEETLHLPPQPMVKLACLLAGDAAAVEWVIGRWKLPNADRDLLRWLSQEPQMPVDVAQQRRMIRRRGKEDWQRWILWHAAQHPSRPEIERGMAELNGWTAPIFPIKGADLLALGYKAGPQLGAVLDRLEREWEEGGYRTDRATLLQRAKESM